MTSPSIIAAKEVLNELKAQRRGVEIIEDEALEKIKFCNERRPFLDELIRCQELRIEDMKVSGMVASDLLWAIRRAAS